MQVDIYADGYYSHKHQTGAIGWVVFIDGIKHGENGHIVIGLRDSVLAEFIACYYAVSEFLINCDNPKLHDIVIHTDNNQVYRMLANNGRGIPRDLVNKCIEFYKMLDEFKSWTRASSLRKDSVNMDRADYLSKIHGRRYKNIIKKSGIKVNWIPYRAVVIRKPRPAEPPNWPTNKKGRTLPLGSYVTCNMDCFV